MNDYNDYNNFLASPSEHGKERENKWKTEGDNVYIGNIVGRQV